MHANEIRILNELRRSSAEMLKAELMERYNLRDDQVRIEVTVSTVDLDLGRQILKDFSIYQDSNFLPEGTDCDLARGEAIHSVWVHRKDGYYGTYLSELNKPKGWDEIES